MRTEHPGSFLLALALLSGCATLADTETGGENLPNAAAGPFRALRTGELGNLRSAPNALADDETFPRDPAVLDADGDPATPAVFGYFSMNPEVPGEEPDLTAPSGAIVRYGAEDGRSFDRAPLVVLTPEAPWEGGTVGAPSVVRVGDEIFLYYAAAGGIGLARSLDGSVFARVPGAVLGPDASGWEAGAVPRSPGVVVLDDGSFRLFYEVPGPGDAARIGEARSDDGVTWTRVGDGPALAPAPAGEGAEPPYDGAWVGAPAPVLARSAEGRPILRVYYAARDSLGRAVVGLAARFDPGSEKSLERAASPVFGSGSSLGPHEPCVLVRPGHTLLFSTQRAGRTKSANYPAVAAGVAPADVSLPAP
ncbi:hypothetical protein [Polyangium jinanense]|uniref:Uncharacterized protein n=1 Tax=Polyangium jinanense TaxID=2829994 RepID=A0A9X3XA84_9BACT|nr:hypothetical protein [Polyangium jinanense]MDC3958761.1 hypothetical protein [Polyangium jinanense]MDC3985258.1 hypothetical protein [Polyangium jinanense]